jgi:prepilin-type N-terminal cleavage/methylation domain-containing protein
VSRVATRLRRHLRSEGGYTLAELIVTMTILSIVLAGLTGLFSAGLRAETDVAFRHVAQSNARNALTYLRQEAHCASAAAWAPAAGSPPVQTLTLTLPTGCFRPVGEAAGTPVNWCTISVATNRFQLYRTAGATCDATGKQFADFLTSGVAFPSYTAPSPTTLGTLTVNFPVDPKSSAGGPGTYRLSGDIVLRNTVRS